MTKDINFCGGLPRSGSTVLMNILQQNPRIFTTSTCPLPKLIEKMVVSSRQDEALQSMNIDVADKAMGEMVKFAAQGWFSGLTDKPVVISKSRNWTPVYHMLPDGKYIATIRDLRDIVESFERIQHRTNAFHTYDGQGVLLPSMTAQEKYHYYFKTPNALSGSYATELSRVVEHAQTGRRKVLFVRYEDLTMDPVRQLKRVYEFLGEEYFEHDLENIEQSELYEHDAAYFRERTSHKVQPSILEKSVEPRRCNPQLLDAIFENNTPYYETFYPEVM